MTSTNLSADQQMEARLKPLLDFLGRHINAHRFLWLLACACFLVAWNRGLSLLYAPVMLILAVQVLSHLLSRHALRGLKVTRQVSPPVQVGGKAIVSYAIQVPAARHQITLHEPQPLGRDDQPFSHFVPVVRPGELVHMAMPCHRRGVFELADLEVSSARPFGVVQPRRRLTPEPVKLVVYPDTFPITHLPMMRSDQAAMDGRQLTANPCTQNEFAGVREYRFGDGLKHVHWGATAKQQSLIVREYESHDRPHLLIILDARAEANLGADPHSTFETAVKITASLVEYAVAHQFGLHVFCGGSRPLTMTVTPGTRSAHDYLKQLAWPRADGQTAYSRDVEQAQNQFGQANTLITFRNHDHPARLPTGSGGWLDIQFLASSFLHPEEPARDDGWTHTSGDHRTLLVGRHSSLEGLFRQF